MVDSSKQQFILAFDQGTTSSRSLVVNSNGEVVGKAQQEFEQIFPKPGWVEHNATEIWKTQIKTAHDAIADAGISPGDVAGIGITNQRETTVIWDRETGEPIHNAIVWQDRRTSDFCSNLREEGHAEAIQERTGLVLDAYFAGSKVRWLLDHVEGARSRAERGELAFGTIDSWLIWNLTEGQLHITDVTNACRTLLFNIENLEWDSEMLELFKIPESLLPEVRTCSEIYAETAPVIFDHPIPIAGVAGDQHAALFGQACHSPGLAKNTYGTGCFMLMNTGETPIRSENKLLTTIAWKVGDTTEYALEGSVFIAGAVVQWLRDQLGLIKDASEIQALAESVADNGGVYFVPAFSGLGAPHWDQYARGGIMGLTRGASKGHLARAALEGIAFQSAEVLLAMTADSEIELEELRVDGGASNNSLLMQFQADLLGVKVVRPILTETTALGAAYLAGLATGVWESQEQIADLWIEDEAFEPEISRERAGELMRKWTKAVGRVKAWEE